MARAPAAGGLVLWPEAGCSMFSVQLERLSRWLFLLSLDCPGRLTFRGLPSWTVSGHGPANWRIKVGR